jgi:small subunit ribosomal protein S2
LVNDLIKQLLDAGVHFGHQTKRWNPKMARYIFGARKGIYIIDLEKTAKALERACAHVEELAMRGESLLFVGTKRQAQEIIAAEATRCGMYYVSQRWLGGTLTNFQTIRKSIKRLQELESMRDDGTIAALTKKEAAGVEKEVTKLRRNLSGIVEMVRLPKAIFVVDAKREEAAVQEARRLGIEVIAMADTNCDPDLVDYPIPANDDAIRSIRLIAGMIADRVLLGRQRQLEVQRAQQEVEAAARAAQAAAEEGSAAVPVPVPDEIIEEVEEKVVSQTEETTKKPSRRRATTKAEADAGAKRAGRPSRAGA